MPHTPERCDDVIALTGRMDRAEEDIASYAVELGTLRELVGALRVDVEVLKTRVALFAAGGAVVGGGTVQLLQAFGSLLAGLPKT